MSDVSRDLLPALYLPPQSQQSIWSRDMWIDKTGSQGLCFAKLQESLKCCTEGQQLVQYLVTYF